MNLKRIAPLFIILLIIAGGNSCMQPTNREALIHYTVLDIGLQQQQENTEMKNAELLHMFDNEVMVNPQNDTIKNIRDKAIEMVKGTKDVCDFITEMKVELVMHTDEVDEEKAKSAVEDPFKVKRRGDYKKTTEFFGTNHPNSDQGRAHVLKIKLEQHKVFLLQFVEKNDMDMMSKKLNLLDPKVPKDPESKESNEAENAWEIFYFFHNPLSGALAELTRWQLIVRTAETDMLVYLFDRIQKAGGNPR